MRFLSVCIACLAAAPASMVSAQPSKDIILVCFYPDASVPGRFTWTEFTSTYKIKESDQWKITEYEFSHESEPDKQGLIFTKSISRVTGIATLSQRHKGGYSSDEAVRQSQPCKRIEPGTKKF